MARDVKAVLAAHAAERDAAHSALPARPARAPRPKQIDAFQGRIAELFVRYPDITAQRVFEIITAEGFTGATFLRDGARTRQRAGLGCQRAAQSSELSIAIDEG